MAVTALKPQCRAISPVFWNKKPTNWWGQTKRCATQMNVRAGPGSHTFMQYSVTFCSQLEAVRDQLWLYGRPSGRPRIIWCFCVKAIMRYATGSLCDGRRSTRTTDKAHGNKRKRHLVGVLPGSIPEMTLIMLFYFGMALSDWRR